MTVEELTSKVEELTTHIANMNVQVGEKDAALKSAQDELASVKGQLASVSTGDHAKTIEDLTSKLTDATKQIAGYTRKEEDVAILKDFPAIKDASLLVGDTSDARREYAKKLVANFGGATPPATPPVGDPEPAPPATPPQGAPATDFAAVPPAGAPVADPTKATKRQEIAGQTAELAGKGDAGAVLNKIFEAKALK